MADDESLFFTGTQYKLSANPPCFRFAALIAVHLSIYLRCIPFNIIFVKNYFPNLNVLNPGKIGIISSPSVE